LAPLKSCTRHHVGRQASTGNAARQISDLSHFAPKPQTHSLPA
jgi:hypothetical protein